MASKWQSHDGDVNPVKAEECVEIRTVGGVFNAGQSSYFCWHRCVDRPEARIIAYRVIGRGEVFSLLNKHFPKSYGAKNARVCHI